MKYFLTVAAGIVLLGTGGWSGTSLALSVDVAGTTLTQDAPGAQCLNLAGEYPGFRIETSEAGKTPQICFNFHRRDTLRVHNVMIVATFARFMFFTRLTPSMKSARWSSFKENPFCSANSRIC